MIDADQTARWAAARSDLGLTMASPIYGRSPSQVADNAVVCVVLPADPMRNDLDFTEDIAELLPSRFDGLTANGVGSLPRTRRTARLVSREAAGGDGGIAGRVGARRDGGAEASIAPSTAFYTAENDPTRIYRLFVLVHIARQVIALQSRLVAGGHAGPGPYQLAMIMPGGAGSRLGAYTETWTRVESMFHADVPSAPEAVDPEAVLDVEQWPVTPDDEEALLERFAERISDAFDDDQRRFRRPGIRRIDPGYG